MTQNTTFQQLFDVLVDRKKNPPARSYTTKLLSGGHSAIAAKIREEADEVIEAAAETGPEGQSHLVHEAADLIYHLFVMLVHRDVSLSELDAEIGRRSGTSGLDEKESRQNN